MTTAGVKAIEAEDNAAYRKQRKEQLAKEQQDRDERYLEIKVATEDKLQRQMEASYEKQAQRMMDAREKELAGIEGRQQSGSSLRQQALGMLGRDRDAETESIREKYRKMREGSNSAAETANMMAAEVLELFQNQHKGGFGFSNQAATGWSQSQRFNTGQSEFLLNQTRKTDSFRSELLNLMKKIAAGGNQVVLSLLDASTN